MIIFFDGKIKMLVEPDSKMFRDLENINETDLNNIYDMENVVQSQSTTTGAIF